MLSRTLFPYQEECIVKIMNIAKGKVGKHRKGVICALKPGSGKTLISLVAARRLLRKKRNEPILVVGEVSTMQDWEANCKDHFDPPLRFAHLDSGRTASELSWFSLKEHDVVACSYDMLCNCERRGDCSEKCSDVTNGMSCVFTRKWGVVILDEAHRVRNDDTNVHESVKSVRSRFNIVLTATPCNNSIEDVLSLFSVIDLQTKRGKKAWSSDYVLRNVKEFKKALRNYLIHSGTKDTDNHFGLTNIIIRSPFLNQPEVDRLMDVRKSMSFKQSLEAFVREKEVCDGVHAVGHVPTKIKMLMNYLETIVVPRLEKANIFCTYKQSIIDVETHCKKHFGRNLQIFTADGSMSATARQNVREEYFNCKGAAILIATCIFHQGVNLHCANHTIQFDSQWNPTVTDQCRGRCERPAQLRTVFNVELIIADTIDDHVWQVAQRKRKLIQAIFEEDISIEEFSEAVRIRNFNDEDCKQNTKDGRIAEKLMRSTCTLYVDDKFNFSAVPATRPIQSIIRKHREARRREDRSETSAISTTTPTVKASTSTLPVRFSIATSPTEPIALKRRRVMQGNRRVELDPLPSLTQTDLVVHSYLPQPPSTPCERPTRFLSMPTIPLLASKPQKRMASEISN